MRPGLAQRTLDLLEHLLLRPARPRSASATRSGVERGWVGPRFQVWLEPPGPAALLVLRGRHTAVGVDNRQLALEVLLDERSLGHVQVPEFGPFEARFEVPLGRLTPVPVEIRSSPALVPDLVIHNGDQRALTFELHALDLELACVGS